jgi:hypothetical protein
MAGSRRRLEIAHLADLFWREVGRVEPFPRSLEASVLWALPIAIVKVPRLGINTLRAWLSERGVTFGKSEADRPLCGCLVAARGRALIFLDGGDAEDTLRFSLAHEVAHSSETTISRGRK